MTWGFGGFNQGLFSGGDNKSSSGGSSAGGQSNASGYYKEKVPRGYKAGKIQQFTPEQIDLFQQMFGHLGPDSYLSRLASGDQSQFDEMEAPALRQFNELQGGLASRFSGMGGMGARHSSGFQNASNQAASDFAQQLQGQRLGLRNQALKDLMSMSTQLLGQRPYERTITEKPKSFLESLALQGAHGLGQGFGAGTSGMMGGM